VQPRCFHGPDRRGEIIIVIGSTIMKIKNSSEAKNFQFKVVKKHNSISSFQSSF